MNKLLNYYYVKIFSIDLQLVICKKIFLTTVKLVLILMIYGCRTEAKSDNIIVAGGKAKLFTWKTLPNEIKKKVGEFHLYYDGGWSINRSKSFKREDAFYLRIAINNKELAELSKSDAFIPEKTLMEKPIFLYGKYKNRWHMMNAGGGNVKETDKSDGFNTILVKRISNIDSVWIGPIPEKPVMLEIVLRGDYSERKDLFPKYNIN